MFWYPMLNHAHCHMPPHTTEFLAQTQATASAVAAGSCGSAMAGIRALTEISVEETVYTTCEDGDD